MAIRAPDGANKCDYLTYIAIQLGLKCRVPLASSLAKMVMFVQNWQVACDSKADEVIRCRWK